MRALVCLTPGHIVKGLLTYDLKKVKMEALRDQQIYARMTSLAISSMFGLKKKKDNCKHNHISFETIYPNLLRRVT